MLFVGLNSNLCNVTDFASQCLNCTCFEKLLFPFLAFSDLCMSLPLLFVFFFLFLSQDSNAPGSRSQMSYHCASCIVPLTEYSEDIFVLVAKKPSAVIPYVLG